MREREISDTTATKDLLQLHTFQMHDLSEIFQPQSMMYGLVPSPYLEIDFPRPIFQQQYLYSDNNMPIINSYNYKLLKVIK